MLNVSVTAPAVVYQHCQCRLHCGVLHLGKHHWQGNVEVLCALFCAVSIAWCAGKTSTIWALLHFLRRTYGYKGRILAAAQSNVAVDNMLETAMRECSC
jgi:hypothetical protein